MKQMLKLSIVLAVYTCAACMGLAAVYNFTAPRIAQAKQAKTTAALKKIFPAADNFQDISTDLPSGFEKIKFQNAFLAEKDGNPIGITVTASGPTYAEASILIGIGLNGKIKMIEFLLLTDTPSLGSKAADEGFSGQFKNKSVNDEFAAGADIQAITGATITSKGVCAIIKAGVNAAKDYLNKNSIPIHEEAVETDNQKIVVPEEDEADTAVLEACLRNFTCQNIPAM